MTTTTQYLKGSRRLAVIHRWLQGIDDPNYEVLPTKKEGKYIVKKRQNQLTTDNDTANEASIEPDANEDPNNKETNEDNTDVNEQPTQPVKPKPLPARKPTATRTKSTANTFEGYSPSKPSGFDPTVNLEILETLKLLGDEIRGKRERKEQKQLINHVIDKRLRRPQRRQLIPQSKSIEEEYYSDDNDDDEHEPQPQPPIFRSRIHR